MFDTAAGPGVDGLGMKRSPCVVRAAADRIVVDRRVEPLRARRIAQDVAPGGRRSRGARGGPFAPRADAVDSLDWRPTTSHAARSVRRTGGRPASTRHASAPPPSGWIPEPTPDRAARGSGGAGAARRLWARRTTGRRRGDAAAAGRRDHRRTRSGAAVDRAARQARGLALGAG